MSEVTENIISSLPPKLLSCPESYSQDKADAADAVAVGVPGIFFIILTKARYRNTRKNKQTHISCDFKPQIQKLLLEIDRYSKVTNKR